MFIVTKIHLKRELKQAKREGNRERVAILEQVLDDGDLLQLVHDANQAEYDYVREARAVSTGWGNPFSDFLSFLFENREAIMEMILMFIQLFALLQPAPVAKPSVK